MKRRTFTLKGNKGSRSVIRQEETEGSKTLRFNKENIREVGMRGNESHVASPAKPTSSSLWRYESSQTARAHGVWPGNPVLAGTGQVVLARRAPANYN